MQATFKTKEQFVADGFTWDIPRMYKGSKKEPGASVAFHMVQQLGGELLKIVDIECADKGRMKATHGGQTYTVYPWMFVEEVRFDKIAKPKILSLHGKSGKFYGVSFEFPCSWDSLQAVDAVKVAKWILKVTRQAPKGVQDGKK